MDKVLELSWIVGNGYLDYLVVFFGMLKYVGIVDGGGWSCCCYGWKFCDCDCYYFLVLGFLVCWGEEMVMGCG